MAAEDTIERLAKAQAVNRVVLGAGLIAVPRVFGRVWSGGAADDERARVLARGLGARDLLLGAGGLLALREHDPRWAARAFGAHAAADAVDLVAVLLSRRALGRSTRAVATTLAAGSAGVAAAYALRVRGGG
ncbi:MAG: hypothetical protein QOH72_1023 [Solirubrobacteraceae bacterium]|nr:hypothetical protein [Solirubrobacteraceae bacterium]